MIIQRCCLIEERIVRNGLTLTSGGNKLRLRAGFRLNIRNGRSAGLIERDLGAQQQGAEAKVCKGEDDIEILVHVTVMQQMMAV